MPHLINKITSAIVFLTIASCATTFAQRKPIITFEKTPCFGSCPVYQLEIYPNRKMKLLSVKYLNIGEGDFSAKLKKKDYQALIHAFHRIRFSELKDSYSTQPVSDLPTRYLSFREGENTKTIMDYVGAPEELTQLEETLQQLVDMARWKKSN